MSMFDNIKDKVTDLVDQQGDAITDGVEKAGDFIDDKTGGQYAGQVDQGQEGLKNALDGLDGQDDDLS